MLLLALKAVAHPLGNRIDLSWILPEQVIDGVRVVRREGRYPQHPQDGAVLADVVDAQGFKDLSVETECYFYYSLFPYVGNPAEYSYENANRVGALATGPHGYATAMLDLLPAIYHRYDNNSQFLARFLKIMGTQFDQFHSYANYSLRLRQIDQTPGSLLPLLGQWIAWRTDNKRDLNSQRREIAQAPALYRRVGLLPTLEATIKRTSSWESRSKEYVHNVFASNRPPRLNLWSLNRNAANDWDNNANVQSQDYCYEGRAAQSLDNNGIRHLFYHTERKGRWEIWSKTTAATELDASLLIELQAGPLSPLLWQALSEQGIAVAQNAALSALSSRVWEILDAGNRFLFERTLTSLRCYRMNSGATEFSASLAVIVGGALNKYPSAALQGAQLWLFWSSYNPVEQRWSLHYRRRSNALWRESGPEPGESTASNPFVEGGVFDANRQRRRAFVVANDSGGLWLFWQEWDGQHWHYRYNFHNGALWGEALDLPLDGGTDPQVQDDFMALLSPALPTPRLLIFWARQRPVASVSAERWQVAWRLKANQNFDTTQWSAVRALPKDAIDDQHDREPFALFNAAAALELFWASSRGDSGWSLWRATLLDSASNAWSAPERVSEALYQQRAPLAFNSSAGTHLLFRNSRKLIHKSSVYRATEVHDDRYAGSTLLDARHQQLLSLRDRFDDALRYSYDCGVAGKRDDSHRIARDTIGAFVQVETLSGAEVEQGIARLRQVLHEFMPMTDRAVFVAETSSQSEYVYHYGQPPSSASVYIGSSYTDEWSANAEALVLEPGEDFDAVLEP